ncbi:MAG: hypothetical protein AAFR77_09050 [Cyanobacteria bacterium J06631_2]
MINALRQSEVEHLALSQLLMLIAMRDQRLTAIRGRTRIDWTFNTGDNDW